MRTIVKRSGTLPLAAIATIVGGAWSGVVSSTDAGVIYAVNTDNNLFSFDSSNPATPLSGTFISGLQPGESVQGIDFRPATGALYAIGSTSRVYILNTSTGVATAVGSDFSPPLNGTAFGVDFNPVTDKIRLVSDTEQNAQLNPVTGSTFATNTPLAYAAGDSNFGVNPNITGIAYSNNFNGAATTTLYGIDSNLDTLVTINPADNGTLHTVGALGINVSNLLGFDIEIGGIAYASVQRTPSGVSELYTINLNTGAATAVGTITGGTFVRDISVVIPEPTSAGLLMLGGIALLTRKRIG